MTLIPPEKSPHPDGTFVMIVETLLGTCDGKCDVPYQSLGVQNLEFDLSGSIESSTTVNVWCSSSEAIFVNKGALQIASGVLKLTMQPDTICTLTTLNNGTKGSHPTPPSSRPFPSRHDDDFSKSVLPLALLHPTHSRVRCAAGTLTMSWRGGSRTCTGAFL